jgi:peroxiredoxin
VTVQATEPAVGETAPDFTLRDQHGQEQSLKARHGARNVLLVFYPYAFTGVCTGEMHALSDAAGRWAELGTDVLAVSCDPIPSLRVFSDRERLELSLLSDFWPHGEVSTAYGAFNTEIGAAGRSSFVIDRQGVVRWTVSNDIPDARDLDAYVQALQELAG